MFERIKMFFGNKIKGKSQLTLTQAAEFLNIPVAKLRKIVKEKAIPHTKINNYIRFDAILLGEWLEKNTVYPDPDKKTEIILNKIIGKPMCPDCKHKMDKGYIISEDDYGRTTRTGAWFCECILRAAPEEEKEEEDGKSERKTCACS